eukprot:Gb_35306 [translate_table: standard]
MDVQITYEDSDRVKDIMWQPRFYDRPDWHSFCHAAISAMPRVLHDSATDWIGITNLAISTRVPECSTSMSKTIDSSAMAFSRAILLMWLSTTSRDFSARRIQSS